MEAFICGNWKMFKTVREAEAFAGRLAGELDIPPRREVIIAPAFPALGAVAIALKGSDIGLAAQNVHEEIEGPFTGEVGAGMLCDVGCQYVIIGHSERRTHYHETDELISRKLGAALRQGLKPIFCIGETLAEREAQAMFTVISRQLKEGLKYVALDDICRVVIAYEPVWAIGTGKTASPEQAQEVHAFIRKEICNKYGKELAGKLRIIYGGSVNPGNIGKLMSEEDINGALVGGASLDVSSFAAIVKYKEV